MLATATGAIAAPIPLRGEPIELNLNAEPLPDFLTRFFTDQGLTVVLSDAVRQDRRTLNGPRSGTPAQIFRGIANSNGLLAYYDGMVVYVYLANERVSRDFAMTPDNVSRFMRAFYEFKLGDEQNNFNASTETGIVMVSGARRFVEQAEALANSLGIMSSTAPAAFKYLPLRYAWASDTSMSVGSRQIVVPGVASILRQLVGLPSVGERGAGRIEQLQRPSADRLRGQGLASQGPQRPSMNPAEFASAGWDAQDGAAYSEAIGQSDAVNFNSAPALPGLAGPQIVADAARNAVIVRDHPDRLPMYEELVRALDTEPRLVEIEATIIDINKGKLRDIGTNWRWRNGRNSVQFGDADTQNDFLRALFGDVLGENIDLLRNLPGLTAGGIVGDSYRFLYRINLLEQEDVARVVSRPQIVTLNDVEAVIESTQTFYVPVGGAYEVDLFNVMAGTTLRVTPHVVEEADGRRRIRMVIAAEDGGLVFQSSSTGFNSQIPLVTRNAVNTHAIINEGESVLLGGLVRDANTQNIDRIPGLGNIPLVGALFRRTNREMERNERLFLITPRLVAQNHITGQQAPSSPHTTPEYLEYQDRELDAARKRQRREDRRGRPAVGAQAAPVSVPPTAGTAPAAPPAVAVAREEDAALRLARMERAAIDAPHGVPST
ncbi:type III secretion system outer membrane ring subunit SctC [Coralloluteibacterium thermophilus]|uniref:Type 3 secretion system secretin n=1 Tax=Coralloluteibacterium thermophilum TaxID=2707049 RepID=A0ABV9NRW9_9GAMM